MNLRVERRFVRCHFSGELHTYLAYFLRGTGSRKISELRTQSPLDEIRHAYVKTGHFFFNITLCWNDYDIFQNI